MFPGLPDCPPEIVGLNEDAGLRDVRLVDRQSAVVEDIAEGGVHPALWRAAHASFGADFGEALALLVGEQLRDTVVVG